MRVPDQSDEKAGIADDLFAAFSHRTHPVDGYYGNDEADTIKAYLKHVAPRQLTFEVLHACPEPEMSFLPNMKLDTQLYYAPSFLSLCVEDFDRLHADASVLLHLFLRTEATAAELFFFSGLCPARFLASFRTSLARLPPSRWEPTPHAMARLQEWFYAGFRPSDIPFLAALTVPEKRAIARAYRFLQRTYRGEFDTDEGLFGRAMHAACAMLEGGNSLPDALGATCPEECRYLADVLEMLEAEFPDEFPRPRTRPIIAALRRHLSG